MSQQFEDTGLELALTFYGEDERFLREDPHPGHRRVDLSWARGVNVVDVELELEII
jgi:hypothetical protein